MEGDEFDWRTTNQLRGGHLVIGAAEQRAQGEQHPQSATPAINTSKFEA